MGTTLKSVPEKIEPEAPPPPRFPRARIRRPVAVSLIWSVPVIAAVVSIVLIAQNLKRIGPTITIYFNEASGLDANQAVVRYRGVRVGSVKSITLAPDLDRVAVRVRLDRSAAELARAGTIFWIVRPEVGAAGFHALETIVSGPYIEAQPARTPGPIEKEFTAASEPPVITDTAGGKEFVLHTLQVRSLGISSPVYFRGLQAGQVQYLELSKDSKLVNIHVVIKPSFASLVRANSVWWNAGGVDVTWHLLSGLNMSAENLRAVVTGGVAFNTPNDNESPAPAGSAFVLHDRPEERWVDWSPAFFLTNTATASSPGNASPMDLETINQQPSKP